MIAERCVNQFAGVGILFELRAWIPKSYFLATCTELEYHWTHCLKKRHSGRLAIRRDPLWTLWAPQDPPQMIQGSPKSQVQCNNGIESWTQSAIGRPLHSTKESKDPESWRGLSPYKIISRFQTPDQPPLMPLIIGPHVNNNWIKYGWCTLKLFRQSLNIIHHSSDQCHEIQAPRSTNPSRA